EAIDATDAVTVQFHSEIVLDLDLIASAQVDAAVAALWVAEHSVQFEVGEFPLRHQVASGNRVVEDAAFRAPAERPLRVAWFPTSNIMTIKQGDRLAPFGRLRRVEGRGAMPLPMNRLAALIGGLTADLIVLDAAFKDHVVGAVLPLGRHGEAEPPRGPIK